MFTEIAIEIARTLKKNKENLDFVAISHRFNPAKHFYPPLLSMDCRQFSAVFEGAKRQITGG